MGVSALVKWLSHYIPPRTLSPILFPNKGSSVCVEMKICILFINNNGPLVATLRKSIFLAVCVPLAGCGAHSEGAGGKKKKKRGRLTRLRKTHSSRMRSFFQDAHAALTLTLQRVDGRRPLRPSGFKTSHTLVHQAAGLYNFWSASSDIRFTPSVGSGQPRQPGCVCFVFLCGALPRY